MNVEKIRKSFPIYKNKSVSDFIYLDSASTSLKHSSVIDELNDYHNSYSANVHRSVYPIAEKATNKYEATRKKLLILLIQIIMKLFLPKIQQNQLIWLHIVGQWIILRKMILY